MTEVTPPRYHNHMDAKYLEATLKKIEGLIEDKAALQEEIKEEMELAKLQGLEPKMMRAMLALRKMEKADAIVQEKTRALYCEALGIVE